MAQTIPGAIAINSATFIAGRAGVRGAIAATAGMIAPSVIVILAVAILLEQALRAGGSIGHARHPWHRSRTDRRGGMDHRPPRLLP